MLKLLNPLSNEYGITVKSYGRRIGAVTYYSGGDSILSPRFLYRLSLIPKQWKTWNKYIRECSPDTVIVNSKILCWMSMLSEVKKRNSICFVRETMNGKSSFFLNKIISKLLSRYDKVIFLSEYDRKKEGLLPSKTQVVHNYVDESQYDIYITRREASEKLGLKNDTFHILYVGGVSEMKGFDIAVRAALKSGENIELISAGNNFDDAFKSSSNSMFEYARKWQNFVKENDKNNQIHMVGRQKNMSACYSACDVLLFPMRSPHQSRPAFEAGYFSKPVIITDFENISEFVRNNDNGFTVRADDVDEIVKIIKKLASDKGLCEKIGKNNWENTYNLHNKEKNCELINNIIKEVTKQ